MEKSKGHVSLKVCSIVMIIGGAVSIIVGIVALLAGLAIGGSDLGVEGANVAALALVGGIIALVGGILELIAGIVGVFNSNKPQKAVACIVWGFIVLVLQIIGIVLSAIAGTSFGSILISIVTGVALPVLYLIGAFLNKKQKNA